MTNVRAILLLSAACLLTGAMNGAVPTELDGAPFRALSAPLAVGARVQIAGIPIDDRSEILELERFEVFAGDADIKVLGANDAVLERPAPPSVQYFRGTIAGEEDSLVFLSVAASRIEGIIFKGDRRFGIAGRPRVEGQVERHVERRGTRDLEGVDIVIAEADVADDIPVDGRGFVCDLENAPIENAPRLSQVVDGRKVASNGSLSTASARWVINLAVETDYELYLNAGSTTGNVTTFIGNLVGAMSTIYNRDLNAQVVVSSLTINSSSSDPFTVVPGTSGTWNGSTVVFSTYHALLEFGDRWHNSPPSSNPRSSTALISGKSQTSGIAWRDVLCDGDFSTNFDNPTGVGHWGGRYTYNGGIDPPADLSVPNPDANAPTYTMPSSNYWPLMQISHETGHNVQSRHTHCISLSAADQATYGRAYVDQCYNSESGCYSGTVGVPAEKGTLMSYCHLRPGGATNSRWLFGKAGEASYVVQDAMKLAIQNATPNLSAITAPSSLAPGASGTASVTNVAGLTYAWTITNGTIDSGQGTSSIDFTATANPTNVKVTATNSAGCSITDNKDITVTSVTYNPPTGVTASAQSSTSVLVSWTLPGGTAPVQYDVYRSADGVNYTQIGSIAHPNTTYTDNTATANTAYLYKARSAGSGGTNESADSNRDLATTVVFTDPTLVSATTQVKTVHITQLRTAVNAVRALTPLGAGTYTDPTLTSGTTHIKRLHVIDLRTALDAARSNLSLTAISYAESLTAGVTTIKKSHINELRAGVQ